jgi:hypothetical protein
MRFARLVYLIAGIYGLLVLVPQYFLEAKNGRDFPPPITHPEYYYGFIGVAVAWQLAFLVISRDPVRFRPLMIPAVVEKASFGIPALALFALGRLHPLVLVPSGLDLLWGVLFVAAYVKTAKSPPV